SRWGREGGRGGVGAVPVDAAAPVDGRAGGDRGRRAGPVGRGRPPRGSGSDAGGAQPRFAHTAHRVLLRPPPGRAGRNDSGRYPRWGRGAWRGGGRAEPGDGAAPVGNDSGRYYWAGPDPEAEVVTRARVAPLPRMALAAEDERTGAETARVAAARGLPVERLGLEAAIDAPVGAILYAPAAPPAAAAAARLAPLAQAAAERRRPLVLLAAFERARGRLGDERAAALAFLAAHGAIPVDDPGAWFETAVPAPAPGVPLGPRVAVVAPPGGWLALAATALSLEEEARGGARLPVADAAAPPADIVLVDAG